MVHPEWPKSQTLGALLSILQRTLSRRVQILLDNSLKQVIASLICNPCQAIDPIALLETDVNSLEDVQNLPYPQLWLLCLVYLVGEPLQTDVQTLHLSMRRKELIKLTSQPGTHALGR